MPTIYQQETGAPLGTLQKLMRRDFPELTEARVTITIMMAANDDGPAIKHHGVPAAAKIKVNGLAARAEGMADATLTIDEKHWLSATDRQREALLAHELTHLVVRRHDSGPMAGQIKTDDCGRPKIGTVPDEYSINGFYSNVERYGDDAPELRTLKAVCCEYRQRSLWDWVAADDSADFDVPMLAGATISMSENPDEPVMRTGT